MSDSPVLPRTEPLLLKGAQAGLLAPGEKEEENTERKPAGEGEEERKGTPKAISCNQGQEFIIQSSPL